MLRTIIAAVETFPGLANLFWEIGPARVHRTLSAFLAERQRSGELRKTDPDEAAHVFLALCAGRYWLSTVLGSGPEVTPAAAEGYARKAVQVFLTAYGPQRPGGAPHRTRLRKRDAVLRSQKTGVRSQKSE